MNLSRIIQRQAELRPSAVAVEIGARAVTYAGFATAIDGMAARLAAEGVGPGATVGISVAAPLGSWMAYLASLRLGGVAIWPLAPAAIHTLGGIDMVVVGSDGGPEFPTGRAKRIAVADPRLDAETSPATAGLVDPDAADAALGRFFLTSGTTGTPKLFYLDHQRLEDRLQHVGSYYGLTFTDRTRAHAVLGPGTAPGFNIPMATWIAGGTVLLAEEGPSGRYAAMAASNLVVVSPAALKRLLDGLGERSFDRDRLLAVAGGRLPAALRDRALARLCDRIQVIYGAKEVGGIATGDSSLIERHPGAVGFVRAGATLEVIDDAGRPLPPGTEGAIRIRTGSMATAYVNDAKHSATIFRDGWFHPGDLGMLMDDGLVVVTGRGSEVLKIGAATFMPDTIESKLGTLNGVRDFCALAVPGRDGANRLAIAVVCGKEVDMKALRAEIAKRLVDQPPFLLARLPRIPRNAMGKIPRPQLAARLAATLVKGAATPRGSAVD